MHSVSLSPEYPGIIYANSHPVELCAQMIEVMSQGVQNEAVGRVLVNMIILNCLHHELKAHGEVISSSRGLPMPTTPLRPDIQQPENKPAPLNFLTEVALQHDLIFKREKIRVSGIADYTLGYSGKGSGSESLVVIKTKRKYLFPKAIPQVLVCMGSSRPLHLIPRLMSMSSNCPQEAITREQGQCDRLRFGDGWAVIRIPQNRQ